MLTLATKGIMKRVRDTRHALGKAVVDGFMKLIFKYEELDFDQEMVIDILERLDNDDKFDGKWPTCYHKQSIIIKDKNDKDF